jgi:hypothetical protein
MSDSEDTVRDDYLTATDDSSGLSRRGAISTFLLLFGGWLAFGRDDSSGIGGFCPEMSKISYIRGRFQQRSVAVPKEEETNVTLEIYNRGGQDGRYQEPVSLTLHNETTDLVVNETTAADLNLSVPAESEQTVDINFTAPNQTGVYRLTAPYLGNTCDTIGFPALVDVEVYDPDQPGYRIMDLAIRDHFQREDLGPVDHTFIDQGNETEAHVWVEAQRDGANAEFNVTVRRDGEFWLVDDVRRRSDR